MNLDSVWHNNNFIISVAAAKKYNEKYFSIHMPPRYLADEHILSAQIPVLITKDSTRGEIYHAITLINSFYSTRMGADDCWRLSDILHKNHSKIWTAIHATDVADVRVVQFVIDAQRSVASDGGGIPPAQKVRIAFSFTTKYFSILNRYVGIGDVYPIYDTLVAKMLDYYFYRQDSKKYGRHYVSCCNTATAKDYEHYYSVLRSVWGTDNYKILDNYLWDFGRRLSVHLPHGTWSKLSAADIVAAIKAIEFNS